MFIHPNWWVHTFRSVLSEKAPPENSYWSHFLEKGCCLSVFFVVMFKGYELGFDNAQGWGVCVFYRGVPEKNLKVKKIRGGGVKIEGRKGGMLGGLRNRLTTIHHKNTIWRVR